MKNKNSVTIIRIVVMLLLVLVVIPLLPILISGRWNWWEAWVMLAVFVLSFILSRALAVRKSPDILKERANYNQHENTQPWDKWLSPLVAFGSVFILLVAGLDALYHWSAGFPLAVEIAGLVLIAGGYILGSYAFIENAYFSGTVRIQDERGHRVVSSGPYGWMRHPGYLGSLVASLGMPLLLDSLWAFIPVVIFGAFFIIRTRLEDRFLQENLPGYREYAQKVRYRLLPGIW
ncbi:MAG TPA: isoprenylcysteine carboxylmethyltransferase family protein [Anaerolineaceae bacterium]|nr:isoprenylcysteine carboxylmethyltransferase family protein [Anaerolineaceae bacterium]HPA34092.1 isoprenylcysteine carboxylmethyltransferase family protein [Anaerolineaceae bacterium]HQF46768.1 isoprenylcysteine carboxylmethyltransferase family protein [Anaerolineaceae bacterium]HQH36010.1 isoprenylcysteine carboxylmethyltransferase family protein [Anaerolineaceae bacterium]HQJ04533.1 isoprenylcysteine carboxylmethyltransferase family protein [Anaerolineaceae bacterium]